MYKLDALEDWREDLQKSNFNGIQASKTNIGVELSESDRREIVAELEGHKEQILLQLKQLPLSGEQYSRFQRRLTLNLAARLTGQTAHSCSIPSETSSRNSVSSSPKWLKPAIVSYAAVFIGLLASQLYGAARMSSTVAGQGQGSLGMGLLIIGLGLGGMMGIGWLFSRKKKGCRKKDKDKKKDESKDDNSWWKWILIGCGGCLGLCGLICGVVGLANGCECSPSCDPDCSGCGNCCESDCGCSGCDCSGCDCGGCDPSCDCGC